MEKAFILELNADLRGIDLPTCEDFEKFFTADNVEISAYGSGGGSSNDRTLVSFGKTVQNGETVYVEGLAEYADKIEKIQIDVTGVSQKVLSFDGERYYISELSSDKAYNRLSIFVKSNVSSSFVVPNIEVYILYN